MTEIVIVSLIKYHFYLLYISVGDRALHSLFPFGHTVLECFAFDSKFNFEVLTRWTSNTDHIGGI